MDLTYQIRHSPPLHSVSHLDAGWSPYHWNEICPWRWCFSPPGLSRFESSHDRMRPRPWSCLGQATSPGAPKSDNAPRSCVTLAR